MGHKFNNAQLIADQFAANGFFVFMPDLFHGDPVQLNRGPDFDFAKWLQGHGPATADPIVEASITELREKYKVKVLSYSPIGVVN
jgi:dienelactone hydrolase